MRSHGARVAGALALAAGIAGAACAAGAQPQEEQPSPGAWPDKAYHWFYNPAGHPSWLSDAQAKSLMLKAAAKWEICGLRMDFLGETAERPGAMDGRNVVGWAQGLPRSMRGLTLGRARGGTLNERDIIFSAQREEFRLHPELLEKVLAHEFGHAIGLTHSSRCDDVMTLAADCGRADPSTLPLVPTPHDVERCRALYASRENGQ
jgi:hypothetical protein